MTSGDTPPDTGSERKNGDLPVVIISEPGSPEFMGKVVDQDEQEDEERAFFEDEECVSLDGSQMNPELGFSSLTLNGHAGVDLGGDLLPIAPDGGYGWVIVFAAFMSNLVVDGICTAFSEFKQSYKDEFHASDAMTALIGSLLIGTYLLVGPIVGGLVNKLGSRKVVIIGAAIGGTGMLLSTLAPNIVVFMLLYGIVGGVGFGMIYLPAIVVVGFYFESKRAVATGIAVAGSGVGTIVMPMLSEYCIKTIGWQYTLVILGGSVFSCALFGILYKELEAPKQVDFGKDVEMEPLKARLSKLDAEDDERSPSQMSDDSPNKRCHSIASRIDIENQMNDPAMARLRNALSECENDDNDSPSTPTKPTLSPVIENAVSKSRAGSTNQGPTLRPRKLTITSMASDMTSTNDLKASRGNLAGTQLNRMSARSFAQSLSRLSGREASTLSIALSGVDPHEFARPLNRQDIFYGGSIKNLKEFKQEGNMQNYRGSVLSIPHSTIAAAASGQNFGTNGDLHNLGSHMGGSRMSRMTGGLGADDMVDEFVDDSYCKFIPLPIRNAFGDMIDVQLLKDPVMMLLCISNLLGMMGFYIPFVFLKDLATTHDIPHENSKYLVPIIGVTNTVGRVFFGWVSDRGYVSALAINNFSLISCGILTLICPLLTTFPLQLVYASLFGFIISAYICLTSIVLADLLGLEKLTNSFGLLVVARGFAALGGSPFAGLVYDITKSYQACFYFAGVVIVIAGLISCAVPFAHKWKRSHGDNEGDYQKDVDAVSGKLSVLTEENEENLTDYQRTIQSLRQQYVLLQELDVEKQRLRELEAQNNGNGLQEVNEEEAAAH